MAITRDTLFARQSELFQINKPARPAHEPEMSDVAVPDPANKQQDPGYRSFFDLSDWRKSRNNLVRSLDDDTVVTVFPDRRRPDRWRWSIVWNGRGKPVFSSDPFPSEIAAMRDCWTSEIAPKRQPGRT
jgi:hypothetical protein